MQAPEWFLLSFFAAIFLGLYVCFWCHQFIQLMLLSDHELPGTYDKIIWGATFLIIPPLAPLIFVVWKNAYLDACKAKHSEAMPK